MRTNLKPTDLTDLADLLDGPHLIDFIGRQVSRRERLYKVLHRLRSGPWLKYFTRTRGATGAAVTPCWPGAAESLEPGIGYYGLFRAEIGIGQGARRLAGAMQAV